MIENTYRVLMRVWSNWYWLTTTPTASEHNIRADSKDD